MYSHYENLRSPLWLFLVVVLFFLWGTVRKAQQKLTQEQKAKILDFSLQKRNYIGLFVLTGFVLLYLTIEKFFPSVLAKLSPLLLLVLLIIVLTILGIITNVLYFKQMKELQLPKEYRHRMILYKLVLFAVILIYVAMPHVLSLWPNIGKFFGSVPHNKVSIIND